MIAVVALALAWIAARVAVTSWMVMLIVGALHAIHPQVPALGYVTCVLGTMIVTLLLYSGPTSSIKGD